VLLAAVGWLGLSRLGPSASAPPTPATAAPQLSPIPAAEPTVAAAAAPEGESPRGPLTYTVEPGDTLGGIAAQFGTSTDALIEANGLEDADTLYVGQQLTVPQ
jgi:LysM repeat protein